MDFRAIKGAVSLKHIVGNDLIGKARHFRAIKGAVSLKQVGLRFREQGP